MGYTRPHFIGQQTVTAGQAGIQFNLDKIASSVASTDLRAYCLGVIVGIKGKLTPGEGSADPDAMQMAHILGNVTLSHKGGFLAQNLDARDLLISNQCEGFFPSDKRGILLTDTLDHTGSEQDFVHTGILAYAPPHFAGDVRQDRNFDGALPVTMQGQHATLTVNLGALPANWTDESESLVLFAVGVYLYTREKYAPRPQQIKAMTYTSDPSLLEGDFQKLYSLSLASVDWKTLGIGGGSAINLSADGLPIIDGVTYAQLAVANLVERNDASLYAAGAPLADLMFHVLDPAHSDRISEMTAANKFKIDQIRTAAGKNLRCVYRGFYTLSAADFAAWAALENVQVSGSDRARIFVGGRPIDQVYLKANEFLGVPVMVDSAKKGR